ncbi:hypothetical protein AAFF_G00339510 [Aldrovandia affinis]|uniref:Uncharacterized protein n=1 Tax=Aldrovandia affinis TaxID=143900 RepID=A0AAD7SKW4_9TELE|nr:hypothetical protein AAFF_G00339510 [Aldrovandia affinis]
MISDHELQKEVRELAATRAELQGQLEREKSERDDHLWQLLRELYDVHPLRARHRWRPAPANALSSKRRAGAHGGQKVEMHLRGFHHFP